MKNNNNEKPSFLDSRSVLCCCCCGSSMCNRKKLEVEVEADRKRNHQIAFTHIISIEIDKIIVSITHICREKKVLINLGIFDELYHPKLKIKKSQKNRNKFRS